MKLYELMETRRICNWHKQRLSRILEEHVGEEIDLCDCCFTKEVVTILSFYYSKINFVHSSNEALNGVLHFNCERARKNPPEQNEIPDNFRSVKDVQKWIKERKPAEVWTTTNNRYSLSIAKLLLAFRPEVTIFLRGISAEELVNDVRKSWFPKADHEDAYWERNGGNLTKVDVINGKVTTVYGDVVEESEYIKARNVMPYAVGTQSLYGNAKYAVFLQDAIDELQKMLAPRVKMLDFLK